MAPATAAPPSTALALCEGIRGSYSNALELAQNIEKARPVANIVAAPLSGGRIPEGFAAAVAVVMVDVQQDTYEIPGPQKKRGLGKKALDDIAGAAGLSWLPHPQSRRLDDGSDPRYCLFQAVGIYRDFGSQPVTVSATKEMDLREGSPTIEAIIERCVRKAQKEAEQARKTLTREEAQRIGREKAENQIRELRLHIVGHAESKARLRVCRTALGLRTSYTEADLKKPFVIARLQFTGRSEDPETQRQLTLMNAAAALGGAAALFGGGVSPAPALPAPHQELPPDVPPVSPSVPPPPVGRGAPDEELDDLDREEEDAYGDADGPAEQGAPPAAAAEPPSTSCLVLPKTKSGPGNSIAATDEKLLTWWRDRFTANLKDDTRSEKYRAKDKELLEAVEAELKWRAARAPAGGAPAAPAAEAPKSTKPY